MKKFFQSLKDELDPRDEWIVDDLLKTEFNLKDWIADTSKIEVEVDSQNIKYWKIQKTKKYVHKVQILDPATGTGTFLNEVVKYIYTIRFEWMTGITHRQMRKHLLETFDKIYIYDLHGNARKKESCPDWSIDQNVFDIMAGVNIIFAVKKKTCK